MTKEEKQLLLIDLCGRLPHGVIVDYKENEFESPHWKITTIYPETLDGWIGYDRKVGAGSESGSRPFKIGEVKPYLRPMSSMTEEEKEDLKKEHLKDEKLYAECLTNAANGDSSMRGKVIPHFAADWCNKYGFDYRGLIPMGLALEAPEDMYKTD